MRGSAASTAKREQPVFVRRFGRTERALHWIHATSFFGLLATGVVLYLPALSEAAGRRGLVKDLHLAVAAGWAAAIVLVIAAGNRAALRTTLAELDVFDADDLRWLRRRAAPQARFNAGQKLHAIVQGAFSILFVISGAMMRVGERDTDLRLPGAVLLHDGLTVGAAMMVAGHLYLSLIHPTTRHALRGMVRGDVRAEWAARHHAKWRQE